jgi:hypothetical protein
MDDLAFLAGTLLFFAFALGYVGVCDLLMRRRS